MSSFSRAAGATLLALSLVLPLAACTGLRPVYSDAGLGAARVEVAYAAPRNRLEQIIYQDLALRLGKAEGQVPLVTVHASRSAAELVTETVSSPLAAKQMKVTATLTVEAPDGTVLFSGTRSQTADFNLDAQALSNQQASAAAERQAALLLADTLRLQTIAALSKWAH